MLVATKDRTCRECGGQLKVIDADDATMTVECLECGHTYLVEPDAFGDGCMTYYLQVAGLGESAEEGGEFSARDPLDALQRLGATHPSHGQTIHLPVLPHLIRAVAEYGVLLLYRHDGETAVRVIHLIENTRRRS